MNRPDVVVVDYGVGNLLSVRRGLEHCGGRVCVSSDAAVIRAAPRVVLPGVGAFANGMTELRREGLDDAVREVARAGTPLLGICLGMQMLLDESEEFGSTTGLGLIAGKVVPVPAVTATRSVQKIPHIGWSSLVPAGRESWEGTVMADVVPGDAVYFVHSFMAHPSDARDRVADCLYGGVPVSAAIGRDNVFGCQFHPEKSGEVGLKILRRFLAR
jgi:imidazole glycerol-phosphate synthase subunit HisH